MAKRDLSKSRYFTYVFMSIWKMIVVFVLMILIIYLNDGTDAIKSTFTDFVDSFSKYTVKVIEDADKVDATTHTMTIHDPLIPVWILLIQISVTYICYAFAKFACKIHIQAFSFAVPVNLAVPITISFLWVMIEMAAEDKCAICEGFHGFQYIFWFTRESNALDYYKDWYNFLMPIVWFL